MVEAVCQSVRLVHEPPLEHPTSQTGLCTWKTSVKGVNPVCTLRLTTYGKFVVDVSAEFGFWSLEIILSPLSVAAEAERLSAEDFSESPWEFLRLSCANKLPRVKLVKFN